MTHFGKLADSNQSDADGDRWTRDRAINNSNRFEAGVDQ